MDTFDQKNFIGPLWLLFEGRDIVMHKPLTLLKLIQEKGSLIRAAAAVPMSYKSAWDLVDRLNNLSRQPLVTSTTGGRNGGETRLTLFGERVLSLYTALENQFKKISREFDRMDLIDSDYFFALKGLLMKTSARNQLKGVITSVKKGSVNSEVTIAISNETTLVATVTNESATNLALTPDIEIIALVKASSLIVFTGEIAPRASTENLLKGSVVEVRVGSVNNEIIIKLTGEKSLTAIITRESCQRLAITEGCIVHAGFSASQVILALPM